MVRHNKFMWNLHTAIGAKTHKPGSVEDKRFLALSLAGEVGEFANLVKKEWRGDDDSEREFKLKDELGDIYGYLILNAIAHGFDLNEILEKITLPKIQARWGNGDTN